MDVFEKLTTASRKRGLQYLVIGGYAVAAHGYGRTTRDVDILASREDHDAWLEVFHAMGYTLLNDGGNFLQFNPPAGEIWPVDIMLTNRPTFEGMLKESVTSAAGTSKIHVVSLNHLLALKFFVIKQNKPHRAHKDLDDVIHLINANRLDIRSVEFRQWVEKYGNDQLYEELLNACK